MELKAPQKWIGGNLLIVVSVCFRRTVPQVMMLPVHPVLKLILILIKTKLIMILLVILIMKLLRVLMTMPTIPVMTPTTMLMVSNVRENTY